MKPKEGKWKVIDVFVMFYLVDSTQNFINFEIGEENSKEINRILESSREKGN